MFFPLRLMATVYVDVFRALPGILVIIVLGLGIPALRIEGVPTDEFFYAVVVLTLVYSAYVSEVYRAGIESVHPSQAAAARSLGLSQFQTMRHVVVPQADPPGDPAAAQRLHRAPEGHGAGVVHRCRRDLPPVPDPRRRDVQLHPYVATALVFLVVTIPLARFTDWLIVRERRATSAGPRRSRARAGAPGCSVGR